MADVRFLSSDAMRGRAAGSPEGARAAEYVERRFREVGLEGAFSGSSFRQSFAIPSGGEGTNVVGLIPGRVFPRSYFVVTAHFDHLGVRSRQIYNGADDNASGTAALFEIAEQVRQSQPQHTVVFAALDAEETGLAGAEALVADPPVPLGAVLVNVNLDMVSRGDGSALWAAGTAHYPFLRPLLEPAFAEAPVPVRFGHDSGAGSDNWTGASDHAAFHRRGVPFVYFGVEDHPDYHKPTDDADRIDPAFYGGAVQAIRDAIAALDASHAALTAAR